MLVHCYQGISRSTAICCAYMMARSTAFLTRDEALSRIRSVRAKASPNSGFMKLLKALEEEIYVRLHRPVAKASESRSTSGD
ncbi:dual specificity protein phosphatase, partial [Acinetobacter baumannii]